MVQEGGRVIPGIGESIKTRLFSHPCNQYFGMQAGRGVSRPIAISTTTTAVDYVECAGCDGFKLAVSFTIPDEFWDGEYLCPTCIGKLLDTDTIEEGDDEMDGVHARKRKRIE